MTKENLPTPLAAQALIELSELCDKNNVYILPRNGLLLGIIRHNKFLPNEAPDLDIIAHEDDVKKIKESNWGSFEIEFRDYLGRGKETAPGKIGNQFFDGNHPVSGEKHEYGSIYIKCKERGINVGGGSLLFNYKPGYLYQPWWVGEKNYKSELDLHIFYHEKFKFKTGAKVLGDTEVPLSHEFLNIKKEDPQWGNVGKMYKSSDWFPTKKVEFYDGFINVPGNAEEILKEDYGDDCLDVMITKKKATTFTRENINKQ